MSWREYIPVQTSHATAKAIPVTLRISRASARYRQRAFLVVRPNLLDGGQDWWKPGAMVRVEFGEGEHDGIIRLTAGGACKLRGNQAARAGKGYPKALSLVINDLPGMHQAGNAVVALDYDYTSEWIEVTLPAWAKGGKPAAGLPVEHKTDNGYQRPPTGGPPTSAAYAAIALAGRPPTSATYADVLRWAVTNDCTSLGGFDLEKVNALRIKKGAPPFRIIKAPPGSAAPRMAAR